MGLGHIDFMQTGNWLRDLTIRRNDGGERHDADDDDGPDGGRCEEPHEMQIW